MEKQRIKDTFLGRLTEEVRRNISSLHCNIIDEAIENALNGTTTYNGRRPEDDDEWYILISQHFILAMTAYEGMLKGVKAAYPDEAINLNVNYRGDTYKYHFEPSGND